jgi:hypothetical protein
VVETDTLTGAVADPFSATELGVTVQAESEGAPLRSRESEIWRLGT